MSRNCDKMWKHLPNLLSTLRIIAVPFFVYFLVVEGGTFEARIALAIYFFASITDTFDGYIARKYDLTSPLGALLDAGADKLFVVAGFICPAIRGILPWWLVVITLVREGYILWMSLSSLKKHVQPTANKSGKLKTIFQMATVVAVLIFMSITDGLSWEGPWLLEYGEANFLTVLVSAIAWIGLVLAIWSAILYTKFYIVKNRELKEQAAAEKTGAC